MRPAWAAASYPPGPAPITIRSYIRGLPRYSRCAASRSARKRAPGAPSITWWSQVSDRPMWSTNSIAPSRRTGLQLDRVHAQNRHLRRIQNGRERFDAQAAQVAHGECGAGEIVRGDRSADGLPRSTPSRAARVRRPRASRCSGSPAPAGRGAYRRQSRGGRWSGAEACHRLVRRSVPASRPAP